jgi:uncharacterized protein
LLSSFRSARVTFSFAYKEQYDQAGLLLSFRPVGSSSSGGPPPKWIKTGVEYYNGQPMVSTVACDAWADWSVTPLQTTGDKADWTTVTVIREGDGKGMSLWVYQLMKGADGAETKVPLREICWVFSDKEDWELTIEAMAARPEKGTSEVLQAEFKDFQVVWS